MKSSLGWVRQHQQCDRGATGVLATFGIGTTLGALAKQILEAASAYQVLEARLKLVPRRNPPASALPVMSCRPPSTLVARSIASPNSYERRPARRSSSESRRRCQDHRGFADSIRLSGASTQEAYAATVQFEIKPSGRLQGDEFRSLMENNWSSCTSLPRRPVERRSAAQDGTEETQRAVPVRDDAEAGQDGLNMLEWADQAKPKRAADFQQMLNPSERRRPS